MEYRLYPLKDQNRLPEICALFAKGLADTTPDYWKWKHFSPNGHPEGMILVAEAEDGSFAGMFALQPEQYACGDQTITVIQNEDLVIDPAHRGTGLMKKLYRYSMEHYGSVGAVGSVSFCNSASYPIFLKYGAEDCGDIFTYNTRKRMLRIYLNRSKVQISDWSIELTDEMPDDLFYSNSTTEFCMVKNDTFMKWKFCDNPDGPFRWLTIRDHGKLKGYLVIQITQGRFRRAVNIYDWDLKDDVSEKVLRQAVKLLLTHGNWVSLWGRYRQEVLKRWAAAGLTEKNDKGTHFILHSFEGQQMPINWQLTRADLDY